MSGLRVVTVSKHFMGGMLLGVAKGFTTNMPEDVEVVAILETDLSKQSQKFQLICRSAEWDQPAEGATLPEITVELTSHVESCEHTVGTWNGGDHGEGDRLVGEYFSDCDGIVVRFRFCPNCGELLQKPAAEADAPLEKSA